MKEKKRTRGRTKERNGLDSGKMQTKSVSDFSIFPRQCVPSLAASTSRVPMREVGTENRGCFLAVKEHAQFAVLFSPDWTVASTRSSRDEKWPLSASLFHIFLVQSEDEKAAESR